MRRLVRALRQRFALERYRVYTPPGSPPPDKVPAGPLKFAGLNGLNLPSDHSGELTLPSPYDSFARDGEAGIVAFHDGELVGWAWIKDTPYDEPLGCGHIAYGAGAKVLRYFEVPPHQRGKGYGVEILREITRRLNRFGRDNVIALVADKNIASIKCFESLGYHRKRNLVVARVCGVAMTSHLE